MPTTIAEQRDAFLLDMQRRARLRPHTLRAYRYELNAAARGLPSALDTISLQDVEQWVTRGEVTASTVSRRLATFSRFFLWAVRHGHCTSNPLLGREPTATRRRLPRPIHAGDDRRAIDAAIASAPQPYRLLFVLLRETGMRAGEALALTIGDVMLAPGREGVRVRDPKNKTERMSSWGQRRRRRVCACCGHT